MLSSKDIRSLRHTFRESKGHTHFPPASLIADKTSTAMFTVAGMQPLIPYLSGQAHPLGDKLHNIQHCIRTNDIEEVGDNSHHTMFFMMGNWSLGSYFKKEAIWRSREFLTQYLKLDPRKIAVTAYKWDTEVPQDTETATLWTEQWVPSDKISFLDANDNRWSPWPVGPCGPCTEMYYWIGESEYPGPDDNVKADDSKWLEIWNNVFMEFYRDESGKLSKLEKQNVDTGMGLERITKVLQQKISPYETDLFAPTIEVLEKLTEKSYAYFLKKDHTTQEIKEATSMRIVADHMRCAIFLMAEWLIPSNEGRGYVLRRIVRRMYFHLNELLDENSKFSDTIKSCKMIIDTIIQQYSARCTILENKNDTIIKVLEQELTQFAKTIKQGQKILMKMIDDLKETKTLSGKDIFMLYDTFGFPLELTEELCKSNNITLDVTGFEVEMEAAKERSRSNTLKGQHKDTDRSVYVTGVAPTQFIGYESLQSDSASVLKKIDFEWYTVVIFDQTPCYATMGWQDHDNGTWIDDDGQTYEIFDVQNYNGVFLHFVRK